MSPVFNDLAPTPFLNEPPTSFATRMAQLTGAPRLNDLALDIGTSWEALIRGDDIAVTLLARRGGTDPAKFARPPFMRSARIFSGSAKSPYQRQH